MVPAQLRCLPERGVNFSPSKSPSIYVPDAPYITHIVLFLSPSTGRGKSSGHSQNPVTWLLYVQSRRLSEV